MSTIIYSGVPYVCHDEIVKEHIKRSVYISMRTIKNLTRSTETNAFCNSTKCVFMHYTCKYWFQMIVRAINWTPQYIDVSTWIVLRVTIINVHFACCWLTDSSCTYIMSPTVYGTEGSELPTAPCMHGWSGAPRNTTCVHAVPHIDSRRAVSGPRVCLKHLHVTTCACIYVAELVQGWCTKA